jgi:hypothetical protein
LTSGSNKTVEGGIGGAERVDNDDVMARTGVDLRDVEEAGERGVVVGAAIVRGSWSWSGTCFVTLHRKCILTSTFLFSASDKLDSTLDRRNGQIKLA